MQSTSLVLLSDQHALMRMMDIVANNVANSSTTGFKREGVAFDTYLVQPKPGQSINFVVDRASYRDVDSGPIETTSNQLDIAIHGPGYIGVQTANGTRYTRGGSFGIDNQGQLVTQSGDPILGDGGQPITIPDNAKDINISGDGVITTKAAGQTATTQLGKLGLVKFDNEQLLKAQGNGLYNTDQLASPAIGSSVVQGALEQSNVKPVVEMTSMMQIMRMYEQATNMVSQENTRLNEAINKLSKTSA